METGRISWIDVAKGLGIISVVIGHIGSLGLPNIFIYSFHMPLFFFISGYLFKKHNNSFLVFLKRKTETLLLPYIYFSIVLILLWTFLNNNVNITKNGFYNTLIGEGGASSLWFLFCLFITEILFYIIINCIQNTYIIYIIIGCGATLSSILSSNQIYLFWKFDVVLTALLFYSIGYFFENFSINNLLNDTNLFPKVILSLIMNLVFCFLNPITRTGHVDMHSSSYGNYIYFLISAIFGILFIVYISKIMEHSKLLSICGQNTLAILAIHWQIPELLRFFMINILKIQNGLIETNLIIKVSYRIISFILLAFCVYFINKYLPFMVAKQKKKSKKTVQSI